MKWKGTGVQKAEICEHVELVTTNMRELSCREWFGDLFNAFGITGLRLKLVLGLDPFLEIPGIFFRAQSQILKSIKPVHCV